MKRIISIILIILTVSSLAVSAFADSIDKIAPELAAKAEDEGGAVVTVRHHYESADECLAKIGELSAYEPCESDDGYVIVGLPYSSMPAVADLDGVDSIVPTVYELPDSVKPEDKYSETLRNVLPELNPDDNVRLMVDLAYSNYIYYGFTEKDFANVDKYLEQYRAVSREFYSTKNQEYLERIQASVDVSDAAESKYSPFVWITVKALDVPVLAALKEVYSIDILSIKPKDIMAETEYLYKKKFNDSIGFIEYDPRIHGSYTFAKYRDYDEIWYHYAKQGVLPDWCLITTVIDISTDIETVLCRRISDRVLISEMGHFKCPYDLYIYDAIQDEFLELNNELDINSYPGLSEAIESLDLGYQVGDADMSGEVDILDATFTQRMLTGILAPRYYPYREAISLLGDIDGNGLDMTDVTRLQRFLTRIID